MSEEVRFPSAVKVCAAALALYEAGRWTTADLSPRDQAKLWEELRDALGLPEGYARGRGVEG
jgi:hypothetical protein